MRQEGPKTPTPGFQTSNEFKWLKSQEGTREDFEIEADTEIIALDLGENRELAGQLEGKVPALYLIGDATERQPISPPQMWGPIQPRRIGEAVKDGYRTAMKI